MCGIAGLVPRVHHPREAVVSMAKSLEHRGPDDQGITVFGPDGPINGLPADPIVRDPVLVHQRLSILDLSAAGRQPMASPDGRYHVVFNGEIYNFLELRCALEGLGHTFQSDCDTEVLLAAHIEWGEEALTRFVGMFAFAVLDRLERTLFLARDPFGIKPLFYVHGDEGFAFASEMAPLLDLHWVPRTADPERIHHYLTTVTGGPLDGSETLFRHVRQLQAAHWMRIGLDDPTPRPAVRYWALDAKARRDIPYDEAVQTVREMFLQNVRLHMRSDVPVGAALSGGIDSSSIVMAMRHLGGPDQRIHAFSYIADDATLSEEPWVDLAAAASGATVHKVRPEVVSFMEELPRLIRIQGEPFSSTSIYAQYRVFKTAREAGIKVTLDGQGADEILAGYRYYYPARIASLVAAGRLIQAARLYRAMCRMPGVDPKALAVQSVERFVPVWLTRLLVRTRVAGRHLRPAWLDTAWFERHDVRPTPAKKTLRQGLRAELERTSTESSLPLLLRYADRNSMASSVESRVPFLTPAFVSYLVSLPEEHHIGPDGTPKRIFRDAMRGLVPDAILDRKDKIGFQTTEREWLRTLDPYVQDLFKSDAAARIPFLRQEQILREWTDVRDGRKTTTTSVWRLINLVQWTIEFEVRYDAGPEAAAVPIAEESLRPALEPIAAPVPSRVPADPFADPGPMPIAA